MLRQVAFASLILLLSMGESPPVARAQTRQTSNFEVASIRLNRNPQPGGNTEITPGRFHGKDLALQWLILTAYRIKSSNLSGNLPSWTIDDRYDVDAKMESPADESGVLAALQALLQERFQLRMHRETREEPVYFLTAAKGGAKLPPGTCVPVKKDLPNECYSSRNDGLVRILDWRGVRLSDPNGVAYRTLVWSLSSPLGRTVIDRTGLTGTYDVHLQWEREVTGVNTTPDLRAPSLPDALEQQLGLKLVAGRGPVEYLVVDHVERPGAN
jgi:uncharacterized protein (TIGR03435 family)